MRKTYVEKSKKIRGRGRPKVNVLSKDLVTTRELFVRTLDGVFLKMICPCKKNHFVNEAGFLSHCKKDHNMKFANFAEACANCGVFVNEKGPFLLFNF